MDSHSRIDTEPTMVEEYPLLGGEKVLSIVDHELRVYARNPSSIEQILRLTKSERLTDIGDAGPALASLAMDSINPSNDEHQNDNEHLHLYEAVFGRDSLRTASYLIESYPELAHQTIIALAELQGVTFNDLNEEEPGRIVHEARTSDDPVAQKLTLERGWHWPYYGAVDTAAEFIRTITSYTELKKDGHQLLQESYTDRAGESHTIADSLERAINWIDYRRSQNKEGLIEFKSSLPMGIENQVWKDSWDAYHHADGTLANHTQGIASIEVQVAAYDALVDAAELYDRHLDDTTKSAALRVKANDLRETILERFWTKEKGGYFVLGLDRDGDSSLRQLKIRTSNMGHALTSRLLDGNNPDIVRMREAVIKQVLSPDMLCAAGIRTLASDEIRFRPGAYQNGSVWIWDTHYIAKGLRRHGHKSEADAIDNHLIAIANETGIFPEYVRGEQTSISLNQRTITLWDEIEQRENIIEQPPQEVQAWTVAAILESKHR